MKLTKIYHIEIRRESFDWKTIATVDAEPSAQGVAKIFEDYCAGIDFDERLNVYMHDQKMRDLVFRGAQIRVTPIYVIG